MLTKMTALFLKYLNKLQTAVTVTNLIKNINLNSKK